MRSITVALGLLFIALCHPSVAQSAGAETTPAPAPAPAPTPAPADDDSELVMFNLTKPLRMSCGAEDTDTTGDKFTWQVNGTALESSALAGRFRLEGEARVLVVERALEDDWGNYSCLVGGVGARRFTARAVPLLRLPSDSNVVEGQKLKLTCRVFGKPYPAVSWAYAPPDSTNASEARDVAEALGGRAVVRDSAAGVPGGELVLEVAEPGDAGVYFCGAPDAAPAHTTLRVKDMYAALWPFLGICAEVFILCAIILVYEKRRTKPELDDSDTDNHDQKKS